MARSLLCLAALGVTLQCGLGQFVPAPQDLTSKMGFAGVPVRYKEVPAGICELDPTVRSYSGYADVDEDQHIFFWFFESRDVDPLTAPLTVWLNGGPGSSSQNGLFQELGPCGVGIDGHVYNNPYSWSKISNMLFVDQPIMVGFSYSVPVRGYLSPTSGGVIPLKEDEACPANVTANCGTWSLPDISLTQNLTINAAPNFWKTLQGFTGAFPQYSGNGFHLASQSYGGHYGPVFGAYIEEQNAKDIPGATKIDLTTVLIGNGWFDSMLQYPAYYNFTVSPGNTYDHPLLNDSQAELMFDRIYGAGNCTDQVQNCRKAGDDKTCQLAGTFCDRNLNDLYKASGRNVYDMRELDPDPFPYNFYRTYLNNPEVLAAIGAYVNYSSFNLAVGLGFSNTGDKTRESGIIEDLRSLVNAGVTVALYAGDADYICNWFGVEAVADEVAVRNWGEAGYVNLSTSDCIVHGQSKQAGRFSFTRVYESGHDVPFYQPLAALEMFSRAIKGLDIATGTVEVEPSSGYVTTGTPKSTYREGNATVQYEVLPANSTYDPAKNGPGAPWKA